MLFPRTPWRLSDPTRKQETVLRVKWPKHGHVCVAEGGGGPMGPDPDLEEGPHKNYERGGKDSKGC